MNLEEHFMPFIKALESGIKEENWILSVMCACTLLDICSSLEGKRGNANYIKWFNNYVKEYQPTLSRRKGFIAKTLEEWINRPHLKPEDIELHTHVYFSGVNAYALRCAFLHDGNGNLSSQIVQSGTGKYEKYKDQILNIENVKFKNDPNLIFNQVGKTAYINPEKYCIAIITGVINWIETINEFKDSDRPNDQRLYSTVQENASKMLMFE
jgi:hypothetical protein